MTYSLNERYIIATIKGADHATLLNLKGRSRKGISRNQEIKSGPV